MSHLEIAQQPQAQMGFDSLAQVSLPYTALPDLALADVSTQTQLFGKTLSQPLIIASMTGGVAHAKTINRHLAEAAQETRVALGVGSQRITLENSDASESFKIVRQHAPDAVIFANMAAVQLNYGCNSAEYQRVIDLIQADGLYLHLNPLQEAMQQGGDTNFSGLLPKIEQLVKKLSVPIFVKEVGHGLSLQAARQLANVGIAGIDVAGTGGSSWAWIEATNSGQHQLAEWFKSVGYTTAESLRQVKSAAPKAPLVASGGIRNPVQALKTRLLGADYYSAATPFLTPALESTAAVVETINLWQRGLQIGLFAIGAASWSQVEPQTEAQTG